MDKYPIQKEIWLVDFEPHVGSEPAKTRPALIVSIHNGGNTVLAVPLTTHITSKRPSFVKMGIEVILDWHQRTNSKSRACTQLLSTIDKSRLVGSNPLFSLKELDFQKVMLGIKRCLGEEDLP